MSDLIDTLVIEVAATVDTLVVEVDAPAIDTMAVEAGNPGPIGPRGEKGETGASVTGKTGDASTVPGPQGERGLTGETGQTGQTGSAGSNGAAGKTILYGTDAPTNQGVDGDFYIRTSTNFIYGPKATTWPAGTSLVGPTGPAGETGQTGQTGQTGSAGSNGAAGKTILYGTDAPTNQGVDGDFYIRTTTNYLYGPKATTWPAGTSLVGPTGAAGSTTWGGITDKPAELTAAQAAATASIRAIGSGATEASAGNHAHADKAALESPTFTGTPAAPTAAAGTNTTQLATCAHVMAAVPRGTYVKLEDVSGFMVAARTANKNGFIRSGGSNYVSGAATSSVTVCVFYLTAADFPAVSGVNTVLRVKGEVHCNDVQPHASMTFVFGLYPVTRPSTSGGTAQAIFTLGTVVSGSECTVSTPAADSSTSVLGSDFALPADGWYALGVVTNQTFATSSFAILRAELQRHNAAI